MQYKHTQPAVANLPEGWVSTVTTGTGLLLK